MTFVDAASRYDLVDRIATGGMGEVWRATDTVLGRTVAVKLLKAEYADDATFRTRFEEEARNAAALHHPNVASVFDFGEAPVEQSGAPRPFLVMELVEGEPLSMLLRPGEPVAPTIAVELVAQAAEGVAAAHAAGIVHRDLKPGNLLVTADGQVKITDFGIARAAAAVPLTTTGQIVGTPHYLSPEQADGGSATVASDVYALGVVLFECLTGGRPFTGETPVAVALAHLRQPVPELPDTVPAELQAVVHMALAKDPAARFPDAAALAAALRQAEAAGIPPTTPRAAPLGSATAAAPTPTAVEALPPGTQVMSLPQHRPPRVMWWIVAVLALLVLVSVVIAWNLVNDNDPSGPAAPSSSTPTTTSSKSTTAEPAIELDESDYLGKRLLAVTTELGDLELDVTTERVTNPGDETARTVSDVTPLTGLHPGDTVVVSYWGPQPTPGDKPTKHPGKGKGHNR